MYNRIPRKDRKFNKTREWLYEEYVVKNRSRKEIAEECGLTLAGLKSTLNKYGIYKPTIDIPIEELRRHLQEGKPVRELCKIFHCEETSVYRRMKANNLSINYKPDYRQYDDTNDEFICNSYLNKMSPKAIADALGISRLAVKTHLKHCNIPIRNAVEAQWVYNNKEYPEELKNYDILYDLYINQRLSKKALAQMFNISAHVIDKALRSFNIPVRGSSDAKIGICCGEEHHNWKGGLTSIYGRLRTAFEVRLRPLVQKRDNNTCQFCGSTENLCVHHIRPFKEIVDEIISEHPDLDVKIDVNLLYDIAVKDSRFIDLNNLITCCKDCHYKLHSSKQ